MACAAIRRRACAGSIPRSASLPNRTPSDASTTTTTSYYYDFDKNKNGILDSNEFYNYAYTAWDANHDGFLSPDEWKLATVRWYGPASAQYKTYTYWDKNGDGHILRFLRFNNGHVRVAEFNPPRETDIDKADIKSIYAIVGRG